MASLSAPLRLPDLPAVYCTGGTTMRMRGCHIVCNGTTVICKGGTQPSERDPAKHAVNVFFNYHNPPKSESEPQEATVDDEADVLWLT